MTKASWAWSLLCWVVTACAAFAHYSGMTFASVALAALAILLFTADLLVAMSSPVRESSVGRLVRQEGGAAVRGAVYLSLAVAGLVAGQLAMVLLHKSAPSEPVSMLCLICNR